MSYKPTHANGTFTKFGAPEIEKLYNDRYKIVVRCNVKGVDSKWHYSNVNNFWKDFGSLYDSPLQVDGSDVGWEPATGETYPNMRLVEVSQNYPRTPNDGAPVLEFTYETLTNAYVQDADDKVDHELNGLRRVTRTVIATEDSSYAKVVGTATIDHTGRGYSSETLTLASAEEVPKRQNEGGFTRIKETWMEAGEISVQTSSGPSGMPNTVVKTVTSFITEPTSNGIALSKSTNNTNGFEQYEYRFLEKADGTSPVDTGGSPVTLVSYEKNIQVRDAGVVSASSVSVTGGTIAVLSVVPPSIKNVKADVTVKLTADSSVASPVAYNLSNTSCSVSTTNTSITPVGVEQGSSLTVSVFNTKTNSKTQSFPNHYKTGTDVNASYSTAAQIVRDDDNIIGEALDQTLDMDIILTGSATQPATSGVYQEDVDPVFFDADGTQYFRKTRYNIPTP